MKKTLTRGLVLLIVIPCSVIACFFSYKIHQLSNQRASIKKDYSVVNNITQGLLSVNTWKNNLILIITHRIDDFEFTPEQEVVLKTQLEKVLHAVVNKADTVINRKQVTVKGKLKKFVFNALVDEEKVHAKVPLFSKTIVDEIQKTENKEKLKNLALSKILEYGHLTKDSIDNTENVDAILQTYSVCDLDSFNTKCELDLTSVNNQMHLFTGLVVAIVIAYLVMWWICRNRLELYAILYMASLVLALIVLTVGLTSPMIEIDARIKEMKFLLIGEYITFHDQVIFFQSKSIIDVVHVLVKTGKWDSVMVGILILVFSIIFPLMKLISSNIYFVGKPSLKANKLVSFFALKSGKWSMADVYVVAVFMAYIGFKGILDNQLEPLNINTTSLSSISTNETTLQPGFVLFVCYVLFTLLLSIILKNITKHNTETNLDANLGLK